jgi:hypothetical protein
VGPGRLGRQYGAEDAQPYHTDNGQGCNQDPGCPRRPIFRWAGRSSRSIQPSRRNQGRQLRALDQQFNQCLSLGQIGSQRRQSLKNPLHRRIPRHVRLLHRHLPLEHQRLHFITCHPCHSSTPSSYSNISDGLGTPTLAPPFAEPRCRPDSASQNALWSSSRVNWLESPLIYPKCMQAGVGSFTRATVDWCRSAGDGAGLVVVNNELRAMRCRACNSEFSRSGTSPRIRPPAARPRRPNESAR